MRWAVADGSPTRERAEKGEVPARREEGETVGKIAGPGSKNRYHIEHVCIVLFIVASSVQLGVMS